jgi:hypothetical protein
VSSAPTGINCGQTCVATFPETTSVTLTATPDPTMVFTGWSGACSGTETCTVVMNAAKSVTATFVQGVPLTVTTDGTGTGAISAGGIDGLDFCRANCLIYVDPTAVVQIIPEPDPGSAASAYASTTSPCTPLALVDPTNGCAITVTSPTTVTVTFTAGSTLEVNTGVVSHIHVTSNPAGIDCTRNTGLDSGFCYGAFPAGSTVTLTNTDPFGPVDPVPNWGGGLCSGPVTTPCVLTMFQDSGEYVSVLIPH